MISERFEGVVAFSGERHVPATVDVDFAWPREREYRVSVRFEGRVFVGEGADAFWALVRAREEFEPQGWRLAVNGASSYCYPSGMQGGTGAWSIYRHSPSSVTAPLEGVRTFDPAGVSEIVTVEEQKAAHRARMAAWRAHRSSTTSSDGGQNHEKSHVD